MHGAKIKIVNTLHIYIFVLQFIFLYQHLQGFALLQRCEKTTATLCVLVNLHRIHKASRAAQQNFTHTIMLLCKRQCLKIGAIINLRSS